MAKISHVNTVRLRIKNVLRSHFQYCQKSQQIIRNHRNGDVVIKTAEITAGNRITFAEIIFKEINAEIDAQIAIGSSVTVIL